MTVSISARERAKRCKAALGLMKQGRGLYAACRASKVDTTTLRGKHNAEVDRLQALSRAKVAEDSTDPVKRRRAMELLRENGWTLDLIGRAWGVTRERARQVIAGE